MILSVLQADIDRFAAIIKTCWKIDVAHNCQEVVRLNTKTYMYEPYNPQFEDIVDTIVEKIRQTREWELSLKKQVEEWDREQKENSSRTSTINNSSETSQTTQPIFTTDETVLYHLDDLPKDVKDQILIDNDQIYSDFVTTMCGPVKGWIDKRRLQDHRSRAASARPAEQELTMIGLTIWIQWLATLYRRTI